MPAPSGANLKRRQVDISSEELPISKCGCSKTRASFGTASSIKAKIKEIRVGYHSKYSGEQKIFVSGLPPLRGLPKAAGYADSGNRGFPRVPQAP
jgi:hypothetical protein